MKECNVNIKNAEIKDMDIKFKEVEANNFMVYSIRNASNRFYVTGSTESGGFVTQEAERTDFVTQRWFFVPTNRRNPNTSYFIFDTFTNTVLSLSRPSTDNGIKLVTLPLSGGLEQRWFVNVLNNNRDQFYFLNELSGKVFDNPRGSTTAGTIQEQYDLNRGDTQRFTITRISMTTSEQNMARKIYERI